MSGLLGATRLRYVVPTELNPVAWWIWAVSVAAAASLTTNPLILGLLMASTVMVVLARRDDSPWGRSFRMYLWLAGFVVVMRIGYRLLFGGGYGATVLVGLPQFEAIVFGAPIRLLGPITIESVLAGAYDGLRLATIILAVGAANSLTSPRRLLSTLPSALYELGTVLVVAVSAFPQLGASVVRVARARKLRQSGQSTRGRFGVIRTVLVPVLSDALDATVWQAASMEGRGFGRTPGVDRTRRRLVTVLVLATLTAIALAWYGFLSPEVSLASVSIGVLQWPMAVLAAALAIATFTVAGRQVNATRFRTPVWGLPEVVTAAAGLAAVAMIATVAATQPADLVASVEPLQWPALPVLAVIAALSAASPAVATPVPAGQVAT